MDIKQIGLIERIFKPRKSQSVKQTSTAQKVDQVSISSKAIQRFKEGTDKRIKEIVMNAPDIRVDKVQEVREKLSKDNYIQNISPEALAEKILKSPFGFQINVL